MLKKDTHGHCPRCGDKYQKHMRDEKMFVSHDGLIHETTKILYYCTECGLFYYESNELL